MTAGGDCPGLNAAIRGVCFAAHDRYQMKIVGIANGYRGLIDEDYKVMEPKDFSGILTQGGTILGTSREKPFKSLGGESDNVDDKVEAIKETYQKLKLDCLVVLGGNGTNTTGHLLSQEGLNILGLPKTIDNDVVGTEQSFGFHSALSIATEAIDRLQSTAQSHNRVMVIELMGNKAGWLSLYAGVAGGSDVILIPEIPYDIKVVSQHLRSLADSGKQFSIVVVAEGAVSIEEEAMDKKDRKKFREQFPSMGYRVAQEIERETGMQTRATVLGYVQRGGMPSATDRILATSLGTAAVDLLAQGTYSRMMALVDNKITSVNLSVPAGKTRSVPPDHELVNTAISVGTCMGVNR